MLPGSAMQLGMVAVAGAAAVEALEANIEPGRVILRLLADGCWLQRGWYERWNRSTECSPRDTQSPRASAWTGLPREVSCVGSRKPRLDDVHTGCCNMRARHVGSPGLSQKGSKCSSWQGETPVQVGRCCAKLRSLSSGGGDGLEAGTAETRGKRQATAPP
jgi:hypothetical protein